MQMSLPDDGLVRKLWPTEIDLYRDHLLRLDPDSRRARFGGAVADEFIRDYVELPFAGTRLIYGFVVDGLLRGSAELRQIGPAGDAEAEVALSIEKPWQSGGVGSALLTQMLLAARNRRIRTLHMMCLADNRRMQLLARKFDAELSFAFGSVVGEVETPYPTPMSMMREAIADSSAFASAVLDVQKRLLRPA